MYHTYKILAKLNQIGSDIICWSEETEIQQSEAFLIVYGDVTERLVGSE